MTGTINSNSWITQFDWSAAGPEAHDPHVLSARLAAMLPARSAYVAPLARSAAARRLGRSVATARSARGWSRTMLAECAGVDPVAIPLLETAALFVDELTPEIVRRIADALDVPPNLWSEVSPT